MTILFLMGDEIPTAAVSDWHDIARYRNKGFATPNATYYSLIKALGENKEFENEIVTSRKNIGIGKEGISWQDYYFDHYLEALSDYSIENTLLSKAMQEAQRIKNKLVLDGRINSQLENIIIGGFVSVENHRMQWVIHTDDENAPTGVSIEITQRVTQNELIEYMKENWAVIGKAIASLPKSPTYHISKRDYRIVELRDKEKYKFSDIPKKITDEFKIVDYDININEDSVETAYRRAKKAIAGTASSKKRNK